MKAWLISLIGVVVLIALAEMILPDGKMRTVIRSTFAVALMLVVLSPLPSIRNGAWMGEVGIQTDTVSVDALNRLKQGAMEQDCELYLAGLGYCVDVTLTCRFDRAHPTVVRASVIGIGDQSIIGKVAAYFDITEEQVYYEYSG